MTGADVLDIARDGIWVLIIVSAPMMIVGLVVGVVIALFQALTQIQEMTLVFVPKIIAIFVTMLLTLPFMGAIMGGYMTARRHDHRRRLTHDLAQLAARDGLSLPADFRAGRRHADADAGARRNRHSRPACG